MLPVLQRLGDAYSFQLPCLLPSNGVKVVERSHLEHGIIATYTKSATVCTCLVMQIPVVGGRYWFTDFDDTLTVERLDGAFMFCCCSLRKMFPTVNTFVDLLVCLKFFIVTCGVCAMCGLSGVLRPGFIHCFQHYICHVLVYIVCFPTYPFSFTFPLLIFSFENRPAPFPGWRS